MKIKNSEAIETYGRLSEILKKCSFKATACLTIVRNKNKLKKITNDIEEARKIILENYAEKDNSGAPIIEDNKYKLKNTDKVAEEMQLLFDKDTEIEFEKINIVDLGENDILGEYIDTLSLFIE